MNLGVSVARRLAWRCVRQARDAVEKLCVLCGGCFPARRDPGTSLPPLVVLVVLVRGTRVQTSALAD